VTRQVLFIQGAGEGAYKEDKLLVDSLQRELGKDFKVHYPVMPDEGDAPYEKWKEQIEKKLATMQGSIILIGHSIGASVLAKYLAETRPSKPVAGIFLIANPFWGGRGWRYEGYEELALPKDTSDKFPKEADVFLYHTHDDEIAPFDHLALYAKLLPRATVREIDSGGHQLNNDLSLVAKDIKQVS
jgi:predicted alpha/beta hydrolase family esterase